VGHHTVRAVLFTRCLPSLSTSELVSESLSLRLELVVCEQALGVKGFELMQCVADLCSVNSGCVRGVGVGFGSPGWRFGRCDFVRWLWCGLKSF
jgi:hypothetical protein